MAELTISTAALTDVDRLYEIECASFSIPWSKNSLTSFLSDSEHTFCITARETGGDSDEIIGYVGVLFVLDEGEISNIAVHPLYRGKGAGYALLHAAQEYCRRAGIRTLHLEVRPSNSHAISLYQKCGFVRSGIRRAYYADNGEDALLYSWNDA